MNIIKEDQRTKEIQSTSMSISRNGLLGLFWGPYELMLFNFDDPKIKFKEAINKSSDPTFSQWNKVNNDNFALTQSNVCKIFDTIEMKKIQSLKGHNKAISSIDWHSLITHSVATTSPDNNRSLCIWDIRNSKLPIHKIDNQIFQQIKWNNAKTHLFATSSNSEIRVWDDRKLLSPINILSAHTGNIIDFDWHFTNKNIMLTSGQDKKIKIWNYVDGNPKLVLEYEEDAICYRCKFDRFDNAITFSSPDAPGGQQISYWDSSDFSKICSTPASLNTITHFELRNTSDYCCQFVTLHRNFDYKIWDINKSIFSKRKRGVSSYGGALENSAPKDRFYLSPSPDHTLNKSKVFPAVQSETFGSAHKNEMLNNMIIHRSDPNLIMRDKSNKSNFEDNEMRIREFDKLVNTNQVTFDKNSEMKSVVAHFNLMNIKCSIQFIYRNPFGDNAFLDVIVLQHRAEKIRPQNLDDLEKILKSTIDDCRRNQIFPIEKCVDVALEYLNKLSSRFSLRTIRALKDPTTPMHSFNSLSDVKVPFPRICGASFSPSGLLVCFLAPEGYMSRFHNTPRSLSEITKQTNSSSSSKGFFYELNKNTTQKQYHKSTIRKLKSTEFNIESPGRKLSSQSNQKQQTHIVLIYNALPLSLFNVSLAKKYSINVTDIESMCQNNSSVVSESNRKDLTEFWQYCIILANGCKPSYNMYSNFIKPWAAQSMGRGLCEMWMNHFIKINDIQSAAMLVIVMRAIDTDLENFYRENRNNSSSISLTTASHKNISQESLMENIHPDNLMLHYPVQNCAYHPSTLNDSVSRNTLSGPGRFRNNSLGDSELISNIKKIDYVTSEVMQRDFQINEQTKLIDPMKNTQYNRILLHYVNLLTAQKLLNVSAKIIQKILHSKFFSAIFGQYNFDVCFFKNYHHDQNCRCFFVDTTRSTVICTDCPPRNVSIHNTDVSRSPIICSVCRNYVRGLFSVCDQCNHGGHVDHLNEWFSRTGIQAVCPTGCGCICLPSKDAYHDLFIPIHLPTM